MTALQAQLEALGFKPTKADTRRVLPPVLVSLFVRLEDVDKQGQARLARNRTSPIAMLQGQKAKWSTCKVRNADLLAYHNTADRHTLMAMPWEAARHLC